MKNMYTTILLVMALCTAVTSAEESRKYWHHHKAEDPNTIVVGERFYSGPQPGETLTGFTVLHLKRNHLQGEFDPVALAAGKPQFIIFIDDSDIGEGIGAFLHTAYWVDKLSQTGLAATVVILTHDRKSEIMFTNMREGIWEFFNSTYQIGYAPEGRDGPGAYGLNRNFPLTILIADAEGKVLYNFPFGNIPQDVPDPHVLGALAAVVGVDRETIDSWLNNNFYARKDYQESTKVMKNKGMQNEDMNKGMNKDMNKDMKNKEMKDKE